MSQKKLIFILNCLILLLFLNCFIFQGISYEDYDLGVKEDRIYTWEITYVNESVLYDLAIEENYDWDYYYDYYEGLQFRWQIDYIYSSQLNSYGEFYWEIEYTFSKGANLEKEDADITETRYSYVAEEPEHLADDWFTRTYSEFSIVVIPKNVSSYLSNFYYWMPSANQTVYSVEGNTLIENRTKIGHHDTTVITYTDDGIQDSYSVYYDDDLGYKYTFQSESKIKPPTFPPWLFIFIIIGIAVAVFVIILVVVIKRRSKAEPEDLSRPVRKAETKTDKKKTKKKKDSKKKEKTTKGGVTNCPYCGSKLEPGDKFCNYCGNTID